MAEPTAGPTVVFQFGSTRVDILQGDLLNPGRPVDAVVSTDDNYLSMGSGVSGLLRRAADSDDYVRLARAQCPVQAGSVVVTEAYHLPEKGLEGVRFVLHGAVIDYDTTDRSLEQLVYTTTIKCLEEAETRRLNRILFPAFATGAGGLTMQECARQMCRAIKDYLLRERPLESISVMLWLPSSIDHPEYAECLQRNETFLRAVQMVLEIPFDPLSHAGCGRDFSGRRRELDLLEDFIANGRGNKRHAVILGGPAIGKRALLEELFRRSREPESALSRGRRLVRLRFGRVHKYTPVSFIYRKLLLALADHEWGDDREAGELRRRIKLATADPGLNCQAMLDFLADHEDHYPEVVYLVDNLPQLLEMEAPDETGPTQGVRAFWSDLDILQDNGVRFVYTARRDTYEILVKERLRPLTKEFQHCIWELSLGCLAPDEPIEWVNTLFQHYLGLEGDAPAFIHEFFAREAGQHPYLIGLLGYSLIRGLKENVLYSQDPIEEYTRSNFRSFFQAARSQVEAPQRRFFQQLLDRASRDARTRSNLESLALAVAREEETQALLEGVARADAQAGTRLRSLLQEDNPRFHLQLDTLARLEADGYLVAAQTRETAQFMARPFALWLQEKFGITSPARGLSNDVVIGFLSPEPDLITTLFGRKGSPLIIAQRRLTQETRASFLENYRACIRHLLLQPDLPAPGPFAGLEQVANFLVTYFATDAIRNFLKEKPAKTTVLLTVDENLQDLPWELMLETAYAGGEDPFLVGRRLVSRQPPSNLGPPVRGEGRVRALLIGNPTDDLKEAEAEVAFVRQQLRQSGSFEIREEDFLVGSQQCQWLPLLDTISKGRYGLIHYSGHSSFDGHQSAWHLADGQITTDLLTSALQNGPPVLVVSSSCDSATGSEPQATSYENQTFDLPSAFLHAGVACYVGTLWSVESWAARQFVEEFYTRFVSGQYNLGECVRRARIAVKGARLTDRRAFILYGDPHLTPADLFPDVLDGAGPAGETS